MAAKPEKVRLDQLLVQRGLAESGSKAQALILAGKVRAPGVKNLKPGEKVSSDQAVEVVEGLPFVSRGGLKLAAALRAFGVTPSGRLCIDLGASTGGFTDCLLQAGAKKVWAVDVGHGQLHESLRRDDRVINREKCHVLSLSREDIASYAAGGPGLLVTVDLSFISLEKVLPHLAAVFDSGTEFVVLVKPQFEAGPKDAPKGVVRNPAVRERVRAQISATAERLGFRKRQDLDCPVLGPEGNQEMLFHMVRT